MRLERAKNAAIAYPTGQNSAAVNTLAAGAAEESGWPDFGKFKQTFARLFGGDDDAVPGLASKQLGNWNREMQGNVVALGQQPAATEGWTIDGANLGSGSAHGNPNNRSETINRGSGTDVFCSIDRANGGTKC